MSRAAWALVGCIFTAGLFGIGYYLGYATTTATWIERDAARAAAESMQRDSLKAHLAAAETRADVATIALDSAIANWERAAGALRAHIVADAVKTTRVATVHVDTSGAVDSARATDTTAVSAAVPARAWALGDLADTARVVSALNACRAVVAASEAYRSACETVQDSLRAMVGVQTQLTARATIQAKAWQAAAERAKRRGGFAVVAGGGVGADMHGHAGAIAGIIAGWRLF